MSDETEARVTALEDRLDRVEELVTELVTVIGAIGTTAQTVLLTHDR